MKVYINEGVVTLYGNPDETSETVSQASLGFAVEIISEQGEWYNVKCSDDYQGWCKKSALATCENGYPKHFVTARVNAFWASLYPSKSIKQAPLDKAPFYALLEVEEEDDEWLTLRMPDQSTVYAKASGFDIGTRPLTVNEMIEQALKFVGVPYLWGGCTPQGFDCSGFTQLMYSLMDKRIPRDAKDQAKLYPSKEETEPGDLIFFGDPVNHVGIFLGGDSFIHASQSGTNEVQISDLLRYPKSSLKQDS